MRAYEFLTEEELDEINRRDFLKKAGMAAMGTALGTAAVDQGAHAAEPLPISNDKWVWDEFHTSVSFDNVVNRLLPAFERKCNVVAAWSTVPPEIDYDSGKAVFSMKVKTKKDFYQQMRIFRLDDTVQVQFGTKIGLSKKQRSKHLAKEIEYYASLVNGK